MPQKEVLEDICSDCERKIDYCTLKEILSHLGVDKKRLENFKCIGDYIREIGIIFQLDDRQAEQFKCIEIYKLDESTKEKGDIGWPEAFRRWNERGYAERFKQYYKEGIKHTELYIKVMTS